MSDVFYDKSYTICRSIISQRLMLLHIGKSKIQDVEKIKAEAEDLKIEFEKYKNGRRTIAFFLSKNYEKLIDIIPHNIGFQSRIAKMEELYLQSLDILKNTI
ncbi:MAG: hypothetical protein ACOYOV_11075 [Bacteroidales bacterium]